MKNKKANLNMIVPSILVLTLGAIILVFGLLILDSLQDNTAGSRSATTTLEAVTQNELVANTSLASSGACEFGGLVINSCNNGTAGGILIAAGNYTVGTNYITNLTTTYSTSNWICNYTYTDGGEACNSANKTIAGLGKFADYWDLIVLAIVISVIISLLLIVFSMRKQQ